jgi:hypothetical protein
MLRAAFREGLRFGVLSPVNTDSVDSETRKISENNVADATEVMHRSTMFFESDK